MKSISLTSTSIPLELLSTENPLILVNIPTYQVSLHKITPLLTLKCRFIINWKTINSNVQYLYRAKVKPRKLIKAPLSTNLLAPDVIIGTSAKLTAAYTREPRNMLITQNL